VLKTREFPAKFPTCRELPHGDWFAATVVSATHSASPETFAVCGKLPVFPGLCPPKSGPQIGDRRKAGFCALIRPAVSNAVTSEEFVEGFTPPDYLIDGFLQRQFIYALTGQTGSGKTAIALFIAYCVAKGRALGAREVQAGRVIVFAGENLDDVRQRWIAMAELFDFDVKTIDVHFVDGVVSLKTVGNFIRKEIEDSGPATLIIVDTSAACFEGINENDNTEVGTYARRLRKLTKMPGGPTVLVNCHPTKNAGDNNLLPRGGGAHLAEIDGNLTCTHNDAVISISTQGKFRGAEFKPLTFETRTATAERLKDSRGRSIWTVYADELADTEVEKRKAKGQEDEDKVLILMLKAKTPPSRAEIAMHCGCVYATGDPNKSKATRILEKLEKEGFVKKERGESYQLTEKGKRAAKEAEDVPF
jgi:hypothetical protein